MTRSALFTKHQRLAVLMARDFRLQGAEEDDVRQELRIALWEATGAYDPGRNVPFEAFARDVMRRRIADAMTSANRRKHQVLSHAVRARRDEDGEVDALDFASSRDLDPAELVQQLEELRGLVGAILGLTPRERHAITKFIAGVEGFDKEEENAIWRARRKLRATA